MMNNVLVTYGIPAWDYTPGCKAAVRLLTFTPLGRRTRQ